MAGQCRVKSKGVWYSSHRRLLTMEWLCAPMTLGVVRGQKHLVGSPNRNSPDKRGDYLWWFQDEVESAEMGNDLQWIGKPVTPPPLLELGLGWQIPFRCSWSGNNSWILLDFVRAASGERHQKGVLKLTRTKLRLTVLEQRTWNAGHFFEPCSPCITTVGSLTSW